MKIIKFRRPTAWMLVGAIALFSLAAIACATTPVDSASENEGSPNIGAPAGVIDGTGPGPVSTTNGTSQTVSVTNSEIVASGYDAPAVEPVTAFAIPEPYVAPVSYGVPTLYSGQLGTANSGIWVTGQATLEIPADIAQVSIGVEARELTVAGARQKAA